MSESSYIPLDSRLLNGVHIERLGMSIYLLAFFIKKQTSSDGTVYYGRPITYRWIREEIPNCKPERTLRMWLSILREGGYVEVHYLPNAGMKIRIVESQKWPTAQLGLFDRGLWKRSGKSEEKLSKCGNPGRQDLAGGSGRILPSLLIIEKDKNSEKRKRAEQIAIDCVEREYPGFKARPIRSAPHLVLELKKKIS